MELLQQVRSSRTVQQLGMLQVSMVFQVDGQ